MPHRPHRPHPDPGRLPLLEETTLCAIQLLIARHPDLLAAPEEVDLLDAEPPLRAAHRLVDALRELTSALASYRDALHDVDEPGPGAHHDLRPSDHT
jgi:hypothetical protein